MKDKIIVSGGIIGCTNSTPAAASADRDGFTSTSCNRSSGKLRSRSRQYAAHHAGAHDGDAVADPRPGVPERVDARFDRSGQHCAIARHLIGHWVSALAGTT